MTDNSKETRLKKKKVSESAGGCISKKGTCSVLVIPAGIFCPFCSPLPSTRCRNTSSDTAVRGLLLLPVQSLMCLYHWHYCQMQKPHSILCHHVTSFLHPTCAIWKMYVPVLIVHCHFQFLCFFPLKQSTFVAMETMMLLRVTCNIKAEIVCFGVLFSFSSGLKHFCGLQEFL